MCVLQAWLLLDGMVLDVTRWLPEHPGGATIIPAQGLNCDCSRFFELYHASRESFLYLQEFYIGELLPSEGAAVPMGGGTQAPSAEFMQQLREFSPWRHEMQQRAAEADKLGRSFTSF
jgi:cytochrome b involved in lipid metabolism